MDPKCGLSSVDPKCGPRGSHEKILLFFGIFLHANLSTQTTSHKPLLMQPIHMQVRRPMWRKGLKSINIEVLPQTMVQNDGMLGFDRGMAAGNAEGPVALMAHALMDLHEALRSDKERGLFARGGSWETRLCELADGEFCEKEASN